MLLTVFTQRNCSRLSSSEVRFYTENGRFAFLSPLWGGGVGATYDDYLRFIEKCISDFLLVLIENFSLGVTVEALQGNIGSKSAILLQRGPVSRFSAQKSRRNSLSYGVKIWTDLSSVLSQCTRLTDGPTDRQTDRIIARPRRIPCSAVKIYSRWSVIFRSCKYSAPIQITESNILQTIET